MASSSDSIPKFLLCPICLQMFTSPKRLPCSHSYCQHCLSKLMDGTGSILKCRECKRQHEIPSDGVASLPDNNLANDLLEFAEILSQSGQCLTEDGLIACSCCSSSELSVAEKFCKDCAKFMCRSCNREHKRNPAMKFHRPVAVEDIGKLFKFHSSREQIHTEFCKVHTKKQLKYFCTTCREVICRICKEENHEKKSTRKRDHTHDVIEIKKANDKGRIKLKEGVSLMKKQKPVVEKFRSTLRSLDLQLDEDREVAEETIKSHVKKLIQVIRDKEIELLEELDSKHRDDKDLIKYGLEHSEKVLANFTRCIDYTIRVLKEENEVDFLSMVGPVNETISELMQEKLDVTGTTGVCLEFISNSSVERILHVEPVGSLRKTKMLSFLPSKPKDKRKHYSSSGIPSFELVSVIEGDEKSEGKLESPHGLTVTPEGTFVIADRFNSRVQILEEGGEYRNHIELSHLNHKFDPVDIAMIFGDKFAITDAQNKYIHICHQYGEVIASFHDRLMFKPCGICVHENGCLYVTDSTDIKVFSSSGDLVKTIEGGRHRFSDLWFLAMNSKGHLIVCDTGNNRIQVLDANGDFLSKFGESEFHFDTPRGVAVDKSDNIYVTSNHKVQMFKQDGTFVCRVDDDEDEMQYPCGLVVMETDDVTRILVSDAGKSRILVYESIQ
ncbi:tripartite motif-containing protein 2-like [Ptychodera flava]|uniref:tripartite motif-containing protein 2-like n=1 Tax=Ptychodera flava TaxID=63121 RepID=UPI00396A3089